MSIANLTTFDPSRNTFSFDSTLQSGILNAMNANSSEDEVNNSTMLPMPFPLPGTELGSALPILGGGDNPNSPANNVDSGEISMNQIRDFFGFSPIEGSMSLDPNALEAPSFSPIGSNPDGEEDGFSFNGIMSTIQNFSPIAFGIRNIIAPIRERINTAYEAYRERQRQASIAEGATSNATNANREAQSAQHDSLAEAFGNREGAGNHDSTGGPSGPSQGPGANATGNGNGLA